MKIKIPKDALAPSLKRALPFTMVEKTKPVLGSVRLTAVRPEDGKAALHIEATNEEITFATSVLCAVEARGSVCVPARQLTDLVSRLPSGAVTIEGGGNECPPVVGLRTPGVVVRQGSSRTTLKGWDEGLFPRLAGLDAVALREVKTAALADALERAGYCASKDASRPALMAVRLGSGEAVSTDGNALAWVHVDGLDTDALVPAASLAALVRTAESARQDTVEVGAGDGWLVCRAGASTVSARLCEVPFPDVAQVMPEGYAWTASIAKDELRAAVRRARVTEIPAVWLEPRADEVVISAKAAADEIRQPIEYEETLAAKVTGATPERVKLSLRLLDGATKAVQGDTVEMRGDGELNPLVLVAPGNEDDRHVVMPMVG